VPFIVDLPIKSMVDLSIVMLVYQRVTSNKYFIYPLVNVYIAMENHHFEWDNSRNQWPFSIAMLNYQRVNENHENYIRSQIVAKSSVTLPTSPVWRLNSVFFSEKVTLCKIVSPKGGRFH
jgi:hypothetical protein